MTQHVSGVIFGEFTSLFITSGVVGTGYTNVGGFGVGGVYVSEIFFGSITVAFVLIFLLLMLVIGLNFFRRWSGVCISFRFLGIFTTGTSNNEK